MFCQQGSSDSDPDKVSAHWPESRRCGKERRGREEREREREGGGERERCGTYLVSFCIRVHGRVCQTISVTGLAFVPRTMYIIMHMYEFKSLDLEQLYCFAPVSLLLIKPG